MDKSFFSKKYISIIAHLIAGLVIIHANLYANESEKIENSISIGEDDSPVKIKIYSSLTCPHCANFHINVFPKINEKYVKTGKVKVIFIDFPLDLAALNASKILNCVEKNKQMITMDLIYEKQDQWTDGSTIEEINKNLKEILTTSGINSEAIDKCLVDENIENKVLNARIKGQKKYSISSTPTIIINEKKFDGSISFENIEKEIKKNI